MPPFRASRQVEFSDTDMAGIAHFASFFRFMEGAEHALLRSVGLSVAMTWKGEKIGFPRVSASCDYLRPARFEDLLAIDVEPTRVGRRSISYAFTFFRGEECLARGQMTSVCCRVSSGQVESIDIPADIRALLAPFEKPAAT